MMFGDIVQYAVRSLSNLQLHLTGVTILENAQPGLPRPVAMTTLLVEQQQEVWSTCLRVGKSQQPLIAHTVAVADAVGT